VTAAAPFHHHPIIHRGGGCGVDGDGNRHRDGGETATTWTSVSRRNLLERRHNRGIAFMVSRGGGIDEDSIKTEENDDIVACDDVEADDDSCDLTTSEHGVESECTSDSVDDGEEEELDEDCRQPSQFSFLSYLHPASTASFTYTKMIHYASILLRVTKRTCVAGARAIRRKEEDRENEVDTLLGRTVHILGEMYHAALNPEDEEVDCVFSDQELDENEDAGESKTRRKRRRRKKKSQHAVHTENKRKHRRRRHHRKRRTREVTCPTTIVTNGGGIIDDNDAIFQIAKQYNIDLPMDDGELPKKYSQSILLSSTTSLNEALSTANANARFLICYIAKKDNQGNRIAIPNLLSTDVIKGANRRPLGKKQTDNTGSYYVWITDSDKDVEAAMKRLKVKPPTSSKHKSSKKATAPILTIVNPASVIAPGGKLAVSPRVLAQHHCHPPPSTSESLLSWMSTIRKRHIRDYAKLQHDRKELALLKERTEGYVSSIQEDAVREAKEKKELQKKKEEEEKEKARLAALEERRAELLENLEEEPEVGTEGVITIALRFPNGKRDTRRFLSGETYVNDVFNWIDAVHGYERETIELSTMNGSKTFRYVNEEESSDEGVVDEEGMGEDVTLESAGLGKMTALRVMEIAKEEEEDEGEGDEEEGESEDE